MDNIILAKDIVLDGGLGATRPNDNIMIFGGTGTGKSMSIVIPNLCNMKEDSLIGSFCKREIVSHAIPFLQKRNYKTHVWNLGNPKDGDLLPDPLLYCHSDEDIQELAHQIANGNPAYERATKYDPYWREACEGLITGLISYILLTENKPSTKKVLDLFYKLIVEEDGKAVSTSLDTQIEWIGRKWPGSLAERKLKSFIQLPFVTASAVRDDTEKSIQTLFPVSIQSAMSEAAYVDFAEFSTQRSAIFIITSPVRTTSYAFANLLFGIAIRQLIEFAETQDNNRLPRDVKLIFDDFSCGFPVQNFEKAISTFRAAGMSSIMLCQSMGQLDSTYGGEKAETILDNCGSIVYFPGGLSPNTCAFIRELCQKSIREILSLEVGKVIVFQSGKAPIISQRYDTPADPLYQELMQSV